MGKGDYRFSFRKLGLGGRETGNNQFFGVNLLQRGNGFCIREYHVLANIDISIGET